MTLPGAEQIRALPGGLYLVQAFEALFDRERVNPRSVGTAKISSGTGTPEGSVVGSVGDLYLRTDGSTSTTLYVKTSGSATKTGWTGK